MNVNRLFKRQLDLVRPTDLEFPILLIGAGGIGSWTALALAKMGCTNITVVDFDDVEMHNLPSQLYTQDQLGKHKVDALAAIVKAFTGVEITPMCMTFEEYFTGAYQPAKVIISAVDSLEARRGIFTHLIDRWYMQPDWDFYIDARMGGELLRVLGVNPNDINSLNYYQKRLFNTKSKPAHEACTSRAIVYNTFMCGGMLAHLVKKYAKQEEVKFDVTFDITQQQTI